MLKTLIAASLVTLLAAPLTHAETFEVKMLNKGAEGAMVFEPAFVKAAVGDTINFVSTDKGQDRKSVV